MILNIPFPLSFSSIKPKPITPANSPLKSTYTNPTFKPLNHSKFHSGISSNMWWADLRAALGQRLNCEGIISTAKVITKDHNLAIPHLVVQDIRGINWFELKKRGFNGVIFDKDNTLTYPYVLSLWAPLKMSLDQCKVAFGDDKVAVYSNTTGLYEYDPDGLKAIELEREIGVKVIRHKVKKPGGDAKEIEKHFGCSSSMLVMVGDRYLTDVVYGNRNGFLTVLTRPLSLKEESFVVRQVRRVEDGIVKWWCKNGVKPIEHGLLGDGVLGLVDLLEKEV